MPCQRYHSACVSRTALLKTAEFTKMLWAMSRMALKKCGSPPKKFGRRRSKNVEDAYSLATWRTVCFTSLCLKSWRIMNGCRISGGKKIVVLGFYEHNIIFCRSSPKNGIGPLLLATKLSRSIYCSLLRSTLGLSQDHCWLRGIVHGYLNIIRQIVLPSRSFRFSLFH